VSGFVLKSECLSFQAGGNRILKDISLRFRSGEIAAVIGPSGSGKSTLIKCLTTTYEPSGGRVTLNGQDLESQEAAYRGSLGYVPQDDIIHPELKVESTLHFAARLRMPPALSNEGIQSQVDAMIQTLGLEERRNLRVRQLSGGQRKRVNIGVELLADPTVLILDEPASGLDPGVEGDLLRFLRQFASSGKLILKTTHSMEYLDEVDQVVLLMDGYLIFSGLLDEMLAHFKIRHAAEVFKKIRSQEAERWQQHFDRAYPATRRLNAP